MGPHGKQEDQKRGYKHATSLSPHDNNRREPITRDTPKTGPSITGRARPKRDTPAILRTVQHPSQKKLVQLPQGRAITRLRPHKASNARHQPPGIHVGKKGLKKQIRKHKKLAPRRQSNVMHTFWFPSLPPLLPSPSLDQRGDNTREHDKTPRTAQHPRATHSNRAPHHRPRKHLQCPPQNGSRVLVKGQGSNWVNKFVSTKCSAGCFRVFSCSAGLCWTLWMLTQHENNNHLVITDLFTPRTLHTRKTQDTNAQHATPDNAPPHRAHTPQLLRRFYAAPP